MKTRPDGSPTLAELGRRAARDTETPTATLSYRLGIELNIRQRKLEAREDVEERLAGMFRIALTGFVANASEGRCGCLCVVSPACVALWSDTLPLLEAEGFRAECKFGRLPHWSADSREMPIISLSWAE